MAKCSAKNLLKLPKTDLHCHLDGSLRIDTVLDIAMKERIKLPCDSERELKEILIPGDSCENLVKYLEAFKITVAVLQNEAALRRAAYELVEDVSRENLRYIEVRFSPILHTSRGLSLNNIVEAVLYGLRKGEKDFKVKTGVIICGLKNLKKSSAVTLARLAVSYKNRGVVGFDMAGPELNYPNINYLDAFKIILKNNVNVTTHAGEAFGPPSIHQAVHYCGAHRVGHGATLREDPDLMNYVNDHRIPLEVCITSNLQTKAVKSLKDHPIREYFDLGLRVTINTDNRLISNTTITNELLICAEKFDFSLDEIKHLIVNGFKSAFLNHKDKIQMLKKINFELFPGGLQAARRR